MATILDYTRLRGYAGLSPASKRMDCVGQWRPKNK